MPIADKIDEVLADGVVSPEEHDKVLAIFELARQIADERDDLRERFQKQHDEQMIQRDQKTVLAIITALGGAAITILSVLLNLGLEMVDIGIYMLPLGGTALGTVVGTYLKEYMSHITTKTKNIVADKTGVNPVDGQPA